VRTDELADEWDRRALGGEEDEEHDRRRSGEPLVSDHTPPATAHGIEDRPPS